MKRNVIDLAVAIVALLTATSSLHAELVLEYDFRTAQTGPTAAVGQASYVSNSGSPDADLLESPDPAVIHDVSSALGPGYDPRITTGYLSVRPVGGDNNDQGLGTANTPSNSDHLMKQYMGEEFFSTGSVVMVLKPQFSGLDGSRRTFFWHGTSNSSNNLVWLLNDDDLKGPALHRNNTAVNPDPPNNVLVGIPNVSWEDDTWYLLGASWKANDEVNAENVMYLRSLNPLGTAISVIADTNLLDGLAPMDREMFLGRRGDTQEESGNSDIALFQLYSNAMTIDDFNALYNELALIPEPASAHLLLIGFVVLGSRLRRKR